MGQYFEIGCEVDRDTFSDYYISKIFSKYGQYFPSKDKSKLIFDDRRLNLHSIVSFYSAVDLSRNEGLIIDSDQQFFTFTILFYPLNNLEHVADIKEFIECCIEILDPIYIYAGSELEICYENLLSKLYWMNYFRNSHFNTSEISKLRRTEKRRNGIICYRDNEPNFDVSKYYLKERETLNFPYTQNGKVDEEGIFEFRGGLFKIYLEPFPDKNDINYKYLNRNVSISFCKEKPKEQEEILVGKLDTSSQKIKKNDDLIGNLWVYLRPLLDSYYQIRFMERSL